jgi:hypothetical protein
VTACAATTEPAGLDGLDGGGAARDVSTGGNPAKLPPGSAAGSSGADSAGHVANDAGVRPPSDAALGPSRGDAGDARPRPVYPAGKPGCGLPAAAFCETFDDVAAADFREERSGELDSRRWSGARMQPGLNPNGAATSVGPATLPSCRHGLPSQVFPGQDALVCDGDTRIQSRHLLMTAAEQAYGQLSLRIRQPFDFRDRTGAIVFDVEGEIENFLLGWPAIAITEEPSPAPSFAVLQNMENGAIPRAGLEVHFMQVCGTEDRVGVHLINVFRNLEERYFYADQGGRTPTCLRTERGALNHFEVRVSRSRVEVWGTDRSENGVDFGELKFLIGVDIDLPFERGYVHVSTHNHASLKYSNDTVDAWTARWDNVGFDGPVIDGTREHSVPDSLDPIVENGVEHRNVGYELGELSEGPRQTLKLSKVDPQNVTTAHLALNGHFDTHAGMPVENFVLHYRLNGNAWVQYRFDAEQLALLHGPNVFDETGTNTRGDGTGIAGAMALWLPLDQAQLRSGDNELEFVTTNVPTGYRAYVANVDLVLER